MKRIGDLEIDQDLALERTEARLQRLAWMLMLLMVVAAFAGLFGPGLFNMAEARGENLRVRYARFERASSMSELEITVSSAAVHDGLIQLWISSDYERSFSIDRVTPAPESATVTRDRLIYLLRAAPGTAASVTVHLKATSGTAGRVTGRAGLVNGGAVTFGQFVWP